MLWSILFTIGLVQGIFLVSVFFSRKNQNRLATQLLSALLLLFVCQILMTCSLPPNGMLLHHSFLGLQWLHFLPFFGCFILYFPLLIMPTALKAGMLNNFLAGKYPMQIFDVVMAVLKMVIFGTYLYLAYRQIKKARMENNTAWQTPFQLRAKWLHKFQLPIGVFVLKAALPCCPFNDHLRSYVDRPAFVFG